jgi:hypothetical protein
MPQVVRAGHVAVVLSGGDGVVKPVVLLKEVPDALRGDDGGLADLRRVSSPPARGLYAGVALGKRLQETQVTVGLLALRGALVVPRAVGGLDDTQVKRVLQEARTLSIRLVDVGGGNLLAEGGGPEFAASGGVEPDQRRLVAVASDSLEGGSRVAPWSFRSIMIRDRAPVSTTSRVVPSVA